MSMIPSIVPSHCQWMEDEDGSGTELCTSEEDDAELEATAERQEAAVSPGSYIEPQH